MGDAVGFLVNNWETVLLVLAGGWLVKIKTAVVSAKKLLQELSEDKAAIENALADKTITEQEAQDIAKELGETLVALHETTAGIMSLLPTAWRRKIPLNLSS